VVAAIEHGIAQALAHRVAPGVLAVSPEDFHRWRRKGARYVPMVLSGMIGNALRATVAATREK
jgi:2-keto-3-deoxy-L-rhamnonate aldolase RhmA